MCLSSQWLDNSITRYRGWDKEELSLEAAQNRLLTYNTTIYPVANEVADYILHNWSDNQVAHLDLKTRMILLNIWNNMPSSPIEEVEDIASLCKVLLQASKA